MRYDDVERPPYHNVPENERTQVQATPDYHVPKPIDPGSPVQDDKPEDNLKRPIAVVVTEPIPEPGITECTVQRYAIPAGRVAQVAGNRRNRTRLLVYGDPTSTDLGMTRHSEFVEDFALTVPTEFPLEFLNNSAMWVINKHASDTQHVNVVDEYTIED